MEQSAAIVVLGVVFHLGGCRSLKERRARLGGLRERYGRNPRIALCEHPSDDPSSSRWTIVVTGSDPRAVGALAGEVERDLEARVDAVVAELVRERL